MAEFLRKRADKLRRRPAAGAARPPPPGQLANGSAGPSQAASPAAGGSGSNSAAASPAGSSSVAPPPSGAHITEFKLVSTGDAGGQRYNMMRLNHAKDIDPRKIAPPLLFNRKDPGPKGPPMFVFDESGKIVGKYLYDEKGKPVLDDEGKHKVDRKAEIDMSLVGGIPGTEGRRKVKKGVKEVYHQDIDVVRMRREEARPWVMESGSQEDGAGPSQPGQFKTPQRWVGKMIEAKSMATVLLINDGTMGLEWNVVPLGREYKFEPERPFKVLDSDAANKMFEHQSKHRIFDRWALREGGPTVVVNAREDARLEQRAARMEMHARIARGEDLKPQVKREQYDDDYKREGRRLERGLEGGEDEELDYDVKDEFQDDDDVNTFYHNEEEEEEAKLQEERLRKEQKMANANVGDRPQIDSGSEDDSDDLFGDKLNTEGKRLRRKLRRGGDDMYGTDDSDEEESEAESVKSKNPEKEKEKDGEKEQSAPPSAEKPRAGSRGPSSRRGTSPIPRRPNPPTSGKAGTAPPGSGAALLAQRAAADRSGSPKRSRQGSPLTGRGQSPDGPSSRAGSPSGSVRGSSPAPGEPRPKPITQQGKRKTATVSPAPSTPVPTGSPSGNKRKTSPTGSVAGSDVGSRKKKKSSSLTPGPAPPAPFPGMITREEVRGWFLAQSKNTFLMQDVITAFRNTLLRNKEHKDTNSKLFLSIISAITHKNEDKTLTFLPDK